MISNLTVNRTITLLVAATGLMLMSAIAVSAMAHLSVEDNLTECAYEAEKLLTQMSAENTDAKVKKRSNLVYACMEARRFEFDFDAYDRIVASTNRLPGAEDDLRKDTFIATVAPFWKRNWKRYWLF